MKFTTWVLVLVALVLLLPQTVASLFALFSTLVMEGIVAPLFRPLPMLAWLYSLFCVWWLLLRFNRTALRSIPWPIWTGMLVGAVGVALFARGYVGVPATRWILNFYMFGGGPLLAAATILLLLARREHQRNRRGDVPAR